MAQQVMQREARWWLRRGLLGVVVVWGAATVTFIGMSLLPGNRATLIAGGASLGGVRPELIDTITREYGFDQPLAVQYGQFLARLVRGEWGTSYQLGRPVAELIWAQLPPTVALAAGAAALGLILAVVIATASAGHPLRRGVASTLELVVISTPSAWIGILLLTVFAFGLRLVPATGGTGVNSLILPWITLALPIAASLSQVMRDGLERSMDQPYAVTVLSRGATPARLRWHHAARHALIPVLTLSGWSFAELLSGVVVIEAVFARPGIGQLLVRAVSGRDLPMVGGIVLFSALVFVVVNLAVDALYRVVDPRLRGSTT